MARDSRPVYLTDGPDGQAPAVQLTGSIVEDDTLRVTVVDGGGTGGGSSMRFISGTTDPSADIGMPGDVYLNTSSGDLFKNNNGTWDVQMNLVGPEGPQGPQGPEGDQGPKGETGEQGPPGVVAADTPITYDSGTQTVGLTPAAFVANADGTDLTTLAASVDALRDALVTAGLMSSS